MQGLSTANYEQKKQDVANSIVARLEPYFPGIKNAIVFRSAVFPDPCRGCWLC